MGKWLHNFLFRPIDASIVSVYRIAFGAFMVYEMIQYFILDYTYQFMDGPEVLFAYSWLPFIKPLSIGVLKGLHIGLLVSAIIITIKLWYRLAMTFFFLGYSYFFFIDKTLYNNHIYLIILIAFVMIFMQADKKYSLRAKFSKKENSGEISTWQQKILIFLICLPYFFGGIAKLSWNWVGTDLPNIIANGAKDSWMYRVLSEKGMTFLIEYGGLVYDLGVIFLLCFKRTRWYGVVLVLVFNLMNHGVLFDDIGLFPFLMICSTILFFDSRQTAIFWDVIFSKKKVHFPTEELDELEDENTEEYEPGTVEEIQPEPVPIQVNWNVKKIAIALGISLFVLLQLALPFRHHLYTDNPEWTGIGSRLSWRMKMQTKEVTQLHVTMTDRNSGDVMPIDAATFLSVNQQIHLAEDPYNLIQLSKYLREKALRTYNDVDPEVRIDMLVKFNGLAPQHMFSPTLDLTQVDETDFKDNSWILPLKKG